MGLTLWSMLYEHVYASHYNHPFYTIKALISYLCYFYLWILHYDWLAPISSFQFILHSTLSFLQSQCLIAMVTLMSCCHPWSCSLMRNDNMAIISCAHITIIYWWLSLNYLLGLNWELKSKMELSTTCFECLWLTYSKSRTILVTWQKPFNQDCGLWLILSCPSNCCIFSFL